ncbi:GntR family transcriptional regulator, partial [Streptomyces azureus]
MRARGPGGGGVAGVRDEPYGASYRGRPAEDGADRRPVQRAL